MDERKLIMTFKNTLGNSFSITIDDPREDIEETDIINAMNPVVFDVLPLTLEEVFTYEMEALGYTFDVKGDKTHE